MLTIAMALMVSAVPPEVQAVVDAIGEPTCPRLFELLAPDFQKAMPAPKWAAWCDGVGKLTDLELLEPKAPWQRYRAKSKQGAMLFEVAFAAGHVSGLKLTRDPGVVPPEVQVLVSAIAEPKCPRVFELLTPEFQKALPADKWPAWCASVGALTDLVGLESKDGWLRYRAKSPSGPVMIDVAFSAGRVGGLRVTPGNAAPSKGATGGPLLSRALEIRKARHVPGMAMLAQQGDAVTAMSVGVRKQGDATPVTPDDVWHLGSDTKAMTATLVAMLVDEKKLTWEAPVTNFFPQWKDVDPGYAKVTLELLLTHRAGLPANPPSDMMLAARGAKDTRAARAELVHALLRQAPGPLGTYAYANSGYLLAGAIVEKVTGQAWETVMQKRLFAPLEMKSCGFGAPASAGKVDQPWAHRSGGDGLEPVPPGVESDNPAALGPAGTVHCSLRDWAKFAALHLRAERGEPTTLVSADSMKRMHAAPAGSQYAMGWLVAERPWAGGRVLTHNGSNTMFYATIWLAPERNLLLLGAANAGTDDTREGLLELLALAVGE